MYGYMGFIIQSGKTDLEKHRLRLEIHNHIKRSFSGKVLQRAAGPGNSPVNKFGTGRGPPGEVWEEKEVGEGEV